MNQIDEEIRKSRECVDTLMRFMNIEPYVDGTLYIMDDDMEEVQHIVIDGMFCIYPDPNREPAKNEIPFDVYNNTRLMSTMLTIFIANKGWGVDMQKITNNRPDRLGHLEILFSNGVTWSSNAYKKDSLKYLDMIMKLQGALPPDFERLKGLDICDTVK